MLHVCAHAAQNRERDCMTTVIIVTVIKIKAFNYWGL